MLGEPWRRQWSSSSGGWTGSSTDPAADIDGDEKTSACWTRYGMKGQKSRSKADSTEGNGQQDSTDLEEEEEAAGGDFKDSEQEISEGDFAVGEGNLDDYDDDDRAGNKNGIGRPAEGPYKTLRQHGAQESEGSVGHPDDCTPCTFYCFSRRGCSRGHECKFCHLDHQSKLRMRREAWKEQQRNKRKVARETASAKEHPVRNVLAAKVVVGKDKSGISLERGVKEERREPWLPAMQGGRPNGAIARPNSVAAACGGVNLPSATASAAAVQLAAAAATLQATGNQTASVAAQLAAAAAAMVNVAPAPTKTIALFEHLQVPGGKDDAEDRFALTMPVSATVTEFFEYSTKQATLAIGQEAHFVPKIVCNRASQASLRFRILPPRGQGPTPRGVEVDPITGVVTAIVNAPVPRMTLVVEAVLPQRCMRATIELEVLDFTVGGYVLGHLEEVAPGQFMMIVYVPEDEALRKNAGVSSGWAPKAFPVDEEESTVNVALGGLGLSRETSVWVPNHRCESLGHSDTDSGLEGTPSWEDDDAGTWPFQLSQGTARLEPFVDLSKLGTPEMPSLGSAGHGSGHCKPCAFIFKDGCAGGINCTFCHLCGPGEKRRRVKEKKAARREPHALYGYN